MKEDTQASSFALLASDGAFDPLEEGFGNGCAISSRRSSKRSCRPRSAAADMSALARARGVTVNGHRTRQVIGTFGAETVKVPRARVIDDAGKASEWCSQGLRRYQRLTKKAEALIAAVYLAGTNTRRVKRRCSACSMVRSARTW